MYQEQREGTFCRITGLPPAHGALGMATPGAGEFSPLSTQVSEWNEKEYARLPQSQPVWVLPI